MAGDAGTIALEAAGVRKVYRRDGRELPVLDVERFAVREELYPAVRAGGHNVAGVASVDDGLVIDVSPMSSVRSAKRGACFDSGVFIKAEAGAVRVHGRQVNGPGPDRGMMFQEFALFPWKTVAGNVAWGLETQGLPRAQVEPTVQKYLDMIGLAEFRGHYPAELSGGMKQRVALARVLACDPEVLLMDEPFGALDAQTREAMQEELTHLWERTGKTIVFVTHDIEEAVYLGDRVVVLTARPGRIREEVPIALPRPRDLTIKKSAQCHAYRNDIWDLIRAEASTPDRPSNPR